MEEIFDYAQAGYSLRRIAKILEVTPTQIERCVRENRAIGKLSKIYKIPRITVYKRIQNGNSLTSALSRPPLPPGIRCRLSIMGRWGNDAMAPQRYLNTIAKRVERAENANPGIGDMTLMREAMAQASMSRKEHARRAAEKRWS